MSVFDLAKVITAHAWNHDGTQIAVCENSPEVYIYANANNPDVKKWKRIHTFKKHTMVVVGIDWSHVHNKIITSSHDVNAFVWTHDSSKDAWKAELTILRINRAALTSRWSPDGLKFAVASGDKAVPICYFEPNQKWWVSKILRKHRSTVLDVAWHPSSQILATASCDFRCRVFSCFIPNIDKKGVRTNLGSPEDHAFGQLITEFDASTSWVEACAWSPSGEQLCFAGHDATLSIATFDSGKQVRCATIKLSGLPYTSLIFMSETALVAAGYGFQPEIFGQAGGSWKLLGSADPKTAGAAKGGKKGGAHGIKNVKMFEQKVKKGTSGDSGVLDLKTLHHNVVTGLMKSQTGFSSAGTDGRIVMWEKSALKKQYPSLSM